METEFVCPVCKNYYTSPVILPCSHNICLPCARRVFEVDGKEEKLWTKWTEDDNLEETMRRRKANCPICDVQLVLPMQGILTLPRNRVLERIMWKHMEQSNKGESHEENILCDFCESFARETATLMCQQCGFCYCGPCFDTVHPRRGPLANHDISTPKVRYGFKDDDYRCPIHKEKVNLFCITCKISICYLCQQFGVHQNHDIKLADAAYQDAQSSVRAKLADLNENHNNVKKIAERYEKLGYILKRAGDDTETHVIRECERLQEIIMEKKEKFLDDIANEYHLKITKLQGNLENCEDAIEECQLLVEYVDEALEEENDCFFLEASESLMKRLSSQGTKLRSVKKPDALDKNPFNHLALDVSFQSRALEKMEWLQAPEPPRFSVEECFVRNRIAHFKWYPPESAVDSYTLQVKTSTLRSKEFVSVYTGKGNVFKLPSLEYGAIVSGRVRAENNAGVGKYSNEIHLKVQKGYEFKMSPQRTCIELQLSPKQDTLKSMNDIPASSLADTPVFDGVHYWRVQVEKCGSDNRHAVVAVGIGTANTALDQYIGDNESSYAVQLHSHLTMWCENTSNRLQLRKSPKEIRDVTFSILLDLNDKTMRVYMNGKMVTNGSTSDFTFKIKEGTYRPAISLSGAAVQVTVLSGLSDPKLVPDQPQFIASDCNVKNTEVTFAWYMPESQIPLDSYMLECFISSGARLEQPPKKFTTVYRGKKRKFTYDAKEYNVNVTARVKAVNMVGEGRPSQEILLKTDKGINFAFDKSNHNDLEFSEGDTLVKQRKSTTTLLYGNIRIPEGLHFWRFRVEKFKGPRGLLAVGVAKPEMQGNVMGEHNDSFAAQIFEDAKILDKCTKNRIPTSKEDLTGSIVAVWLNLTNNVMNIYLDGLLLKDESSPEKQKRICTFSGVHSPIKPAVTLKGGDIQLSLVSGLQSPKEPAPPLILSKECQADNTTVLFSWDVASRDTCVDFFVLEVATKKIGKQTEFGRYREFYRGRLKKHMLKNMPYNTEVAGRVRAVNFAGDGRPSEDVIMATAKGLKFQLDPSTLNGDIRLEIENTVAKLSTPVYSFVLGNTELLQGRHYWRIHIDDFLGQNQTAIAGIGVASRDLTDPILGEDINSYALQIHENPKVTCRNSKNRIQIKKTSAEAKHSNIGVHIDLDKKWMNIYFNGKLLTDSGRPKGPTFIINTGSFYPAISLYGTNIIMTLHTNEDYEGD